MYTSNSNEISDTQSIAMEDDQEFLPKHIASLSYNGTRRVVPGDDAAKNALKQTLDDLYIPLETAEGNQFILRKYMAFVEKAYKYFSKESDLPPKTIYEEAIESTKI